VTEDALLSGDYCMKLPKVSEESEDVGTNPIFLEEHVGMMMVEPL